MKEEILKKLTPRELTILELFCHGTNNYQIGKEINVSIHTVKVHISSIIKKLNAKNRTDAAYIAASNNLFDE